MKKFLFTLPLLSFLFSPVFASDFAITFEWGKTPDCDSGSPDYIDNPQFVLKNVPSGTTSIRFKMRDLDSRYNHGEGVVAYSGQDTIEPGAFEYGGPCPPGEVHSYKWLAQAKDSSGNVLAEATAKRDFPE